MAVQFTLRGSTLLFACLVSSIVNDSSNTHSNDMWLWKWTHGLLILVLPLLQPMLFEKIEF